jgi:Domain of unknown function (DUF3471)
MLAYYPNAKFTVVVLANLNGPAAQEIANDLHTLAEGGSVVLPSERKIVKIDPKIFDRYVGNYQLAPNFILRVTRDGDRFLAQATGQGQVEIFPESEHDFLRIKAGVINMHPASRVQPPSQRNPSKSRCIQRYSRPTWAHIN